MRIVVAIMGIFLILSATVSAQSAVSGKGRASVSSIRSLINDINNIQGEITDMRNTFLAEPNGIIPKLEKYVQDVKNCANNGNLHLGGSNCADGMGVLQSAELKGSRSYSQTCSEGLTQRSSGTLDEGVKWWHGGSDYIFCTK